MKFFKKDYGVSLNQLLRDTADDYEVKDNKFIEKNLIRYDISLHTKKIQRSRYLKFDDNVLNLDSMKDNVQRYNTKKV